MTLRSRAASAAVALAVAVAGCGGKDAQDPPPPKLDGTVTVGMMAPISREGELGSGAKDLTDGAQLAVDEVNRTTGVTGAKLELKVVDDGCSAPVAYEAAKEFMADDLRLAGVIGGFCDGATVREAAVIDALTLPFLVISPSASGLTGLRTTFVIKAGSKPAAEFGDAFQARYDRAPSERAERGYVAVRALARAANAAKSLDAAAVAERLGGDGGFQAAR